MTRPSANDDHAAIAHHAHPPRVAHPASCKRGADPHPPHSCRHPPPTPARRHQTCRRRGVVSRRRQHAPRDQAADGGHAPPETTWLEMVRQRRQMRSSSPFAAGTRRSTPAPDGRRCGHCWPSRAANSSRPSPNSRRPSTRWPVQITNGLVVDTPTLSGQSIDPAITGDTVHPLRACRT